MNKEKYTNREITNLSKETPLIINAPYPYVALNDLGEILPRLDSRINGPVVNSYGNRLISLLEQVSPDNTSFFTLNMKSANEQMQEIALNEAAMNRGVIILDRYINPQSDSGNFFRLELSRNAKGGLTTRPGSSSTPEQQISSLIDWLNQSNFEEYIFMDDVLAFADTLSPLLKFLQEEVPNKKFRVITAIASSQGIWSGVEKLKAVAGIDAEFLTLAVAGKQSEWTSGMALPAIRDFTFLGGKISPDEEGRSLSYPYFFPFSIPQLSFLPKESRVQASVEFLALNVELISAINQELNQRLTIRDLVNKGFGIPSTNITELMPYIPSPTLDTDLEIYLQYCQEIVLQNQGLITNIAMS